jgi:peptidylprolyl isomerase domain and WD repeat-containing protein 1
MSAPTEGGAKRAREEESDDDMVGPAPPPPGAADDDEDEPEVGPAMPPKAKKKKTLAFEQVYLDSMPSASMYEKSYMHRDDVTCVAVTPGTDFFITGSEDGHLKFWKKRYEGIEFVKHFRSHVGPVVGLSVSADGLYCATIGHDNSAKIYDVVNFDMTLMLRLPFAPTACEFVYKKGEAQQKIAVADATGKIHVYDAASGSTEPVKVLDTHRAAVRVMKYNAAKRVVISADDKGVIEYWSPSTYEFPHDAVSFRFKLDTDLYALAKAKTKALTLEVSPDGEQFTTTGPDRKVRVFRFGSGKLRYVIDESLESANDAQRSGNPTYALEDIDFGRRVAVDREMGRLLQDSATGYPNAIFDESGNFILYATLLGIKVVNLVTNRCARIVGKVENTERFARLAMFQGVPQKDKRSRGSGKDIKAATEKDPTLVCSAFQKSRLYLFTRREPEDGDDAGGGRDVFNEKPAARDVVAPTLAASEASSALARTCVLHTTVGDIHIKLFPDECPKTLENFSTHCRNKYYDNLIFHRVIKGFMLQTGDPLGDGTGGTSIWGGEFADEISRDLRHDRPYTVSMANAGPNTNGSQFFITTVATPWLDGKHTVFGRVVKGADVVHAIEKTKTDKNDKPTTDIKIQSVTLGF